MFLEPLVTGDRGCRHHLGAANITDVWRSFNKTYSLVFAGGAIGTVIRYLLSGMHPIASLPIGILLANMIGSLILGGVVTYIEEFSPLGAQRIRAALGTGLCGGLTTFSSLCAGTIALAQSHSDFLALLYATLTLFFGLAAFTSSVVSVRLISSQRKGS